MTPVVLPAYYATNRGGRGGINSGRVTRGVGRSSSLSSYSTPSEEGGDDGIYTTLVDSRGDGMLRQVLDEEDEENHENEGDGGETIIDTEEQSSTRRPLHNRRTRRRRICDAVVLAYDVNRMETLERCAEHWLPLITRSYGLEVPVILAGNKIDLLNPWRLTPTRLQIKCMENQFSTSLVFQKVLPH
eukprot:CAMPEP_0113302912 /NCGR_PEP_ID=MMETSP0010_2-20120614/3545_1 /TAXON_ID=216773 ORGANISM="Corethron hystrix, Strain 308" /NCGR_SAMPLE_ID=MMETSP0010_2 /ASSEMBLY_ACC=CAM_ASM_000155 /LENGTH=186 /DNA_ID=CAMNT_0000156817 /DNA_START=235 /DNA_END=795 /DNA_ORIENTATION=- /assembly_acc=CAM_ASM_000155